MNDQPTPPDREAQISQILAYMEQHRDQFDMRQQLLDAGHPSDLVDEAQRRLDGGTMASDFRYRREAQISQLMAYLEQHRAEYSLVALRKQLLDAGHPKIVVDEALCRLDGGKTSGSGGRPRLFGCLLLPVNWLLMAFASSLNAYLPIAILLTELLVIAATRNSPGREGISRILLWMVIWTFVIPAIGALLFGACIALNGGKI
jgi:hypothetical protein